MLAMSSTLRRECRWVAANMAIFLDVAFFVLLVHGGVALGLSSDGTVASGWSGPPILQVIDWAWGNVIYSLFLSPLVVLAVVPYRLLVHFLGHPRAMAVVTALGCATLAIALLPNLGLTDILELGSVAMGFALVVRLPGQTLAELPPLVRGGIAGLAMGFILVIGSCAALGWAADRAGRHEWAEAGALAVGSTALTGWLLFVDLFRDHVPDLNYFLVAILLAGFWSGVAVLVVRMAPVRLRSLRRGHA